MRGLHRDIGVQLAAREFRGGLAVGLGDCTRLRLIGNALAQHIQHCGVAARLKLGDALQCLVQRFAGDVARSDAPHDRLGDVRQDSENGASEQAHWVGARGMRGHHSSGEMR